jgi:hypothetical protein
MLFIQITTMRRSGRGSIWSTVGTAPRAKTPPPRSRPRTGAHRWGPDPLAPPPIEHVLPRVPPRRGRGAPEPARSENPVAPLVPAGAPPADPLEPPPMKHAVPSVPAQPGRRAVRARASAPADRAQQR